MKTVIVALVAVSALAASTAASAAPWHHHGRHQICGFRHHHRFCHW